MPSRQDRRKLSVEIDLVLDLDKRVQNHRSAGVEIDLVSVEAGISSPNSGHNDKSRIS